jgi:TM2 domain-containing membrane protein YozV
MAKISKPDANPVVALLLTWFVFGTGHILINGQQRKWLMILLTWLIGYVLCCLPGVVIMVFSIIDSYQTAQRLHAGEEIDENEYTFVPLYKIVKIIDKSATCSKAV